LTTAIIPARAPAGWFTVRENGRYKPRAAFKLRRHPNIKP
jgi:hypothetical protein